MELEKLHDLLERIATLLQVEERRLGTRFGLQPSHLRALRYLGRCNRYSDSPAAVAEYLGITKGPASQTLILLQELGFVTRSRDGEDRRRVHLRLTPAGRRVVNRVSPPALIKTALRSLPDLGDRLQDGLERLLRGFQGSNRYRTFGLCGTCRHLRPAVGAQALHCGLTGERLTPGDTTLVCREHEHPLLEAR